MKPVLALAAAALMASASVGAMAAAAAFKVVDDIKGPDGGWDFVRVDPTHDRLWMTRGVSVMTVDLKSGEIRAGLAPGERLHDVLPVNGGHEILVTNGGTNSVAFADAVTGEVKARVPTGKNPDAAAYDPATGLVLVMDHDGGEVVLIDPKAHRSVGTVAVGGGLEMAAVDGRGHAFVNVEDRNETVELDVRTRTVLRHIALPGCDGPTGVAYIARKNWLVAACNGSTVVMDVAGASGETVATLKTGEEADGVAVDENRGLAFVPGREGNLSVISLAGDKPAVLQVIRTEANNRTLALDPRNGRVYLPVAKLTPPVTQGGRPTAAPGTFHVLVVGS